MEKAIDSLYLNKNIDLYITGSHALLLSGELAMFLSGRYIEIKMLPLSFKEYIEYNKTNNDEKMYLNYINKSSFPYSINLENENEIDEYLTNIYNTIVIKDIISRKNLNVTILQNISKFMFSNIGSILSVKKIADTMTSDGLSISTHTVDSYLSSLVDSFIFNKVSRFDVKGKQLLTSGEKYYATDVTMRYAILGRKNIDVEHILENIVYLELIRRGYKVYIGKSQDKEIDFICENKDGFIYYQVALSVRDENTFNREIGALKSINDHYPKFILTMDLDPDADYDGIKKINVLDWLINK